MVSSSLVLAGFACLLLTNLVLSLHVNGPHRSTDDAQLLPDRGHDKPLRQLLCLLVRHTLLTTDIHESEESEFVVDLDIFASVEN